jgi:hypothetical protein
MPLRTKREMSFRILAMHEVFLTPLLPFKDYIVAHGEHPVSNGVGLGNHFYADYSFPEQQINVSLIHGPMFHCSLDAPYEWRLNGEGEPEGYKTEEELYILLAKILGGSYGLPE